ncbi:hypothetical protein [Streptomyces sp. NPDC002054]|uniref:hypothetical protein n=1 Tax=Streptomyces sp. NPDC002054 TaxID=3154663 RepID=UPI003331E0FB
MRTARVTVTAALASAALLGLTACNGSDSADSAKSGSKASTSATPTPSPSVSKAPFADLSGPEIAEKSLAATRAAQTLRVKGQVLEDGKPMTVDLAITKTGDCAGSVSVAKEGSMKIIKNPTYLYFKADAQFFRNSLKGAPKAQRDAVVKQLADRWVKKTASAADSKEISAMCDLDELLGEFGTASLARKGQETQLPAGPAFTLTNTTADGDETYWVATQGEPFMLKATVTGKENGELNFSEFNKPVDTQAPADKDIVDGDKLGGGSNDSA